MKKTLAILVAATAAFASSASFAFGNDGLSVAQLNQIIKNAASSHESKAQFQQAIIQLVSSTAASPLAEKSGVTEPNKTACENASNALATANKAYTQDINEGKYCGSDFMKYSTWAAAALVSASQVADGLCDRHPGATFTAAELMLAELKLGNAFYYQNSCPILSLDK